MKCRKIFSILLFSGTIFLTGCRSDSNGTPDYPDISEARTYSGSTLHLKYCGQLMPAKIVTYQPSGLGDDDILFCKGVTDLSQLSSIGLSGTGPAPGILPGSATSELMISLRPENGRYEFDGAGATEYISTYAYEGFLQGDSCILEIYDVKLRNSSLANSVWKPSPLKTEGVNAVSLPFHLLWEIDPSAGIDIDLTDLLKALVLAPIVPVYNNTAYSSFSQLLEETLQTVAFLENGNIIVRYYSSVGGATQLMTSVGNTLQYVDPSPSDMKLFPNPTSLFGRWLVAQSNSEGIPDISFKSPAKSKADSGSSSDSEIVDGLVKKLIPFVLGLTEEGIPLTCEQTEDILEVYLGTPVVIELIGEVVKAVISDPAITDHLAQLALSNPQIAELMKKLQDILPYIEQILENTTRIEIGLSFEKYR